MIRILLLFADDTLYIVRWCRILRRNIHGRVLPSEVSETGCNNLRPENFLSVISWDVVRAHSNLYWV